jgi:multicomponent Na+:H+ antiporter subunit E
MIGRATRARWQRRLTFVGALAIAWVMLWDQVTIANVAGGLLVGAGMLIAFPLPSGHEPRLTVRPIACVRLAAGVLGQLVTSNLLISREIVSRNTRLRTGIVAVRMRTDSPKLLSTVANILALSPGSMAVAASNGPPTLYVHFLALDDVVEVRRRVERLERRIIEAFGSESDRRMVLVRPDETVAGP